MAPFAGGRILAIRAGALGDTVLALPALSALSRMTTVGKGESRLELLGTAPFTAIALAPGPAAAVHSMNRGLFRGLFQEGADDAELLDFLARFELVVSWSRLPLLSAKLARRARLRPGLRRGGATPCIEASPQPPAGVHASDHLFHALEPLGIRGPAPVPNILAGEREKAEARAFIDSTGLRAGRFVAVHPSSGSVLKNWPVARFRALGERIRADGVALVWVEGEADASVLAALEASGEAAVARRLPLRVLSALLGEAGVFIGNDSGVTHLAAASGAPSIALFGPTDSRQWAPRGRQVTVVDFGIPVDTLWGKAREMFRGH